MEGGFRGEGGTPELFNQILIGRFSLPLFRRMLEQSISIINAVMDYKEKIIFSSSSELEYEFDNDNDIPSTADRL